ncbi:type IV secretion protein IcmB [Acidithiobacillus sp. M4-SHS-6]|uniref:type IV secretion protein IcmB n=1 Tax=Acidithiobacillus sp. M4-SHS-6 TaxID=3383024 RepID=UPI0039BE9108
MLAQYIQLHGIHRWNVMSQQVEDEIDEESETGLRSFVKPVEETREAVVLEGGGLASYFWLDGTKSIIDADGLMALAQNLSKMMGTLFEHPGRVLSIRYFRDVTRSQQQYQKNLEALIAKADRLGFKPEFAHFLMQRSRLAKYYVPQGAMLCVETHLSALDPRVVKDAVKNNAKKVKAANLPLWLLKNGQNPFKLLDDMDMTHRSTVSSVESLFRHPMINLSLTPLEVDDAITILRNQVGIDPVFDHQHPYSVNQTPQPRIVNNKLLVQPSRIAESVIPEDMENLKGGVVRSGSGYFVPMIVDLGVTRPEAATMAELLHDLRTDIPFSITWRLQGGALSLANARYFAATMMKFMNKTANGQIQESIQELRNAHYDHHDPICAMQMIVESWAWNDEKNATETALRRAKNLESSLRTNWGIRLQRMVTDPLLSHLAAQPGFLAKSSTPILPINLSDALKLMPFGMATSPWSADDPSHATFWLRSLQRKIMPFALGDSRKQNSFISLIFGLSGYGKSVMVANQILSLILSQTDFLPYLALIDVGYGGPSVIEMLRYFLKDPDLAVGFDLHTRGRTINPFDTPLGYRYPLGSHKDFLVNLLVSIVRQPGHTTEDFVDQIAVSLVDAAYRLRSDGVHGRPHRYVTGMDREIDEAMQQVETDRKTKWWDVVDALFAKGETDLALSAQRYAMPVLSDLIDVCNDDPVITSQFGDIRHPQLQIPVLKLIALGITQAVERWPMLAGHSDFSLGKAKLMAVNLEHVVKDRSTSGLKQAGIMYLMARFMLTKDFLFHPLDAKSAPDAYRRYHEIRAERLFTLPKMGVYDELHNTNGLEAITNQLEKDAREWRKNNGNLLLSSQMPQDFSDVLVNIATSIYILTNPYGPKDNPLVDKFSLTQDEAQIISSYCVGPEEGGSGTFCIWRTKSGGTFKQLGYVMAPPAELWAYTTTPKDRQLRLLLTERIGYMESLEILAQRYPGGSSMKDLALRKKLEKAKDIQAMMAEKDDGLDPDVKNLGEELVRLWNEFVLRNLRKAG